MTRLHAGRRIPPGVIGITGTPGVGKKSVASELASRIGYRLIEISRFAVECNFLLGEDEMGLVVDIRRLSRELRERLKKPGVIIVGHLLSSVTRRGSVDLVVVLRCSPKELRERLIGRGYSQNKIRANMEAEMIDVCLYEAIRRYGRRKVVEFDTTGKTPREVVSEILDYLDGRIDREGLTVDWLRSVKPEDLVKMGDL